MAFVWGILSGVGIAAAFYLGWRWRIYHKRRHWMARLEPLTGLSLPSSDKGLLWMRTDLEDQIMVHLLKQIEQQQVEIESLTEHKQDWEILSAQLPLGFIQVDQNNLVLRCNGVAQNLLRIENWRPDIKVLLEWVRSYELDQLVQQTRQPMLKTSPKTIKHKSARSIRQMREWAFYPSGGESKPVPIRGWAIPLSQGQVALFLEDRLEAKTLAQQRDRWASDVAHELKTPLTSIRLVGETLQSRVDPSARYWVDRLLNEIIRLSCLVQDLLELSSLNLGSAAALQMRPINLVPLVHRAWDSLIPQSEPRQQTLAYEGPEELHLWGDEQRLYRLLLNLLDNSIKYGKIGTPAHITLSVQKGMATLEIYDHGPGLREDAFRAIFEPFYRTDTARARSEGGTGLGLAIVKQIVEAHGGTVTASNHPETGGLWIRCLLKTKPHQP